SATGRASLLFAALSAFGAVTAAAAPGTDAPVDLAAQLRREILTSGAAKCPEAAAYALERPHAAAGPTVVGIAVFFQDLVAINDVEQTLDMDVYVLARWRDPRLADASRGLTSADCPLPTGKLWVPLLEPDRLRSRQMFYPDRFLVDGDGIVTLMRRLWAKVSYPLDLHDFPFDRHHWTTTVWPVESRADEMTFLALDRMSGRSERLSLQGWRVGTPRLEASSATRDGRSGTFARLDAIVDVDRDWAYYAWKLGLPLTLIVLMAYGVYYIPASAVPQQIGLGTTSMLTMIAYMLTLNSTLPRISYLTRADRFFVGSALLVFLGLAKGVLTLALAQGPKAAVIEQVDRTGRWLYPLAVVANLFAGFFFGAVPRCGGRRSRGESPHVADPFRSGGLVRRGLSAAVVAASRPDRRRRTPDTHVEPPPFTLARSLDREHVLLAQFIDQARGGGHRFDERAGEHELSAGPVRQVEKVGRVRRRRSLGGFHHQTWIGRRHG